MYLAKRSLTLSVVLILGVLLLLGGCTAAKKPLPQTEQTPAAPRSIEPPNNSPTAHNSVYPSEVAQWAMDGAKQVAGVKDTTAVISGNTIYLGLQPEPGASTKQVVDHVLKQVTEPHYTVMVTTDKALFHRIQAVAEGIAQGHPISTYDREIQDIGIRIKPKT